MDFDFNTNLFINQLIIGLINGSLIALIALGYTLVYGIVELINFAHGEVFMMGAFFASTVVGIIGVTSKSSWAAIFITASFGLLGAMIFSAGLNYGIDRIAYRRLRSAPRLAPLIAAIGFSFILQNVGIYWKGSDPFIPPSLVATDIKSFNILAEWFGVTPRIRLRPLDVMVIGVTIPLLFFLTWFVFKTRIGKAMRATAQDREAAALMGIDVNRTISYAFLLGGALAGAAGMITLYYNNSARYQMGFRYGLYAFTAAVLGGVGNLTGAVVGAFILGLIWALSDGFMGTYVSWWGSQWTPAVIFGVLVIILVFRPSGLLGEHTTDKV